MTLPLIAASVPYASPRPDAPVVLDGDVVTLQDTGRSNAFPDIVHFGDGELLVIYREAFAHSQQTGLNGGDLFTQRSLDYGNTWGAPINILDDPVRDLRDPCLSILSDGTLTCTYFLFEDDNPDLTLKTSRGPYVITSTDKGVTWSAPQLIGNAWNFKAQNSCPIVEDLLGGHLMVGTYGKDIGEQYLNTGVWVADGTGAAALAGPWTFVPLLDTDGTNPINPNEPRPGVQPDGSYVCLQRHGGQQTALLTADSPFGPWSEPTPVIGGSGAQATGRPTWLRLASGKVVLGYRGQNNADGRSPATLATNLDGDLTGWTGITSFGPYTQGQMTYIGLCEVEPGWIGVVYGIEYASTNSDIYFRYARDGAAVPRPSKITDLGAGPVRLTA
jgi:hypothetical protein